MDGDDAVAAVVAIADCDARWTEEDVGGVDGSEAGGVGQGSGVQERCQEGFQPGGVGGGVAGVDVRVEGGELVVWGVLVRVMESMGTCSEL